jgi:hypothetical protein
MTEEQYLETQKTVTKICDLIRILNLTEFVKAINHSEAIAPIMDPTLFRAAQANLANVKSMAIALMEVQKKLPTAEEVNEGILNAQLYKNRERNSKMEISESCIMCDSTNFLIARNMLATRTCCACLFSWEPSKKKNRVKRK